MSEQQKHYTEEDFNRDMGFTTDRAADAGLYDEYTEPRRSKKAKGQDEGGKGRGRKRGKKKNPKRNWKKSLLLILVALLAIAGCCVVLVRGYLYDKLDNVNRIEVSDEDWGIDPRVKEELKDYKNIVLLGVDTRENKGEDIEHTRSDAIIIVTINTKTNDVKLTSVYRDSFLCLEEEGYYNIDKVNHAHAYGGPVNVVRSLNRNMDMNIDDFVRVDWRAVMEVTDAMGGLDIDVKESEINELNKYIPRTARALSVDYKLVEKPGLQTLDGVQVATYCRIRKNDGDDYRAGRMRDVILAAVEKAKKMNLADLNNVIDVGMRDITTSMASKTMMGMILDLTNYNIENGGGWPEELVGTMIDGVSYDIPVTLKKEVIALHKKLFGQEDYQPTDRVLIINERIKSESDYYGGEDLDYDLLRQYDKKYGNGVKGSDI